MWGAMFPIAKIGLDAGAEPFWMVTLTFATAAVVMFPLAAVSRARRPSARGLLESGAIGALMIGGINIPLFWGEQFATGGAAAIVYATSPALSLVFLTAYNRGPRPNVRKVGALGLGLLGVIVLSLAAARGGPITDPWALVAFSLGAVCQGGGAVLIARRRPQGEGLWGQASQFAGATIAGLLVLGLLLPAPVLPLTLAVVGPMAYVALVSLVAGYVIFFRLIRASGPVSANLVTFVNPVVALLLGVLAFGETFQIFEGVGLLLVLVALVGLELPEHPRASQPSPSVGGSLART